MLQESQLSPQDVLKDHSKGSLEGSEARILLKRNDSSFICETNQPSTVEEEPDL